MSKVRTAMTRLPLLGGALCLDFANTTGWRPSPADEEFLRDYEDLVAWAEHGGAVGAAEARSLLKAAEDVPDRARAAHRRAIALRECVYRIFAAVAAGTEPEPLDLNLLNESVRDANRHLALASVPGGFAWTWQGVERALDLPLWRVARSAADLLVSSDLGRVRECAGDKCDWLFLDSSKNHSRRWCDMTTCGNRAKAQRNYARRRVAAAGSSALRAGKGRKA